MPAIRSPLYGDFTNNGDARFTNRSDFASDADRIDPDNTYYTSEASGTDAGIVDVEFANDDADQTVNCYNTTHFYRIIVDKGVDDTYVLSMQASSEDHFRLLGYANDNVNSDEQNACPKQQCFRSS